MKIPWLVGLLLAILNTHGFAQDDTGGQVVANFIWSAEELADLSAHSPGNNFGVGGNNLVIDHTGKSPLQITLHTLGSAITSQITSRHYAIVGQMVYEDVAPGSYLEMWSYFAPTKPGEPEGAYFSRTLGDSGPTAKLEGTADQVREFILPFDASGTAAKLQRIEFNLHLTGSGHVHLSYVRLVQFPDASTPAPASVANVPPPVPKPPHVAQPEGKELYTFGWPDWFADLQHDPKMQVSPETWSLELRYWGESPTDLELQRVEQNILSMLDSNQFAVEGSALYSKVAPGSYLEMWCFFAPEKPGDPPIGYVTRTLDSSGPMAKLEGTNDQQWRPFQIPFDITGAKTHLQRVIIRLHLAGGYGTQIFFHEVKFVEYPNGHFPATVASVQNLSPSSNAPEPARLIGSHAASASTTKSNGIDWRSFLLGVAMTGITLLVATGTIFLARLWQRRNHERELRRIASLDS